MKDFIHSGIPNDLMTTETFGERSLKVEISSQGIQKQLFYSYLKDDDGSREMTIDGSINSTSFGIQPPQGQIYRVAEWMIYIQDAKGFDVTNFGSNGVLVNGIRPQLNGIDIIEYPIKTNGDIAGLAYDMRLDEFGNADDVLVAKLTFTNTGQYIRLTESDRLSLLVSDDLTSISNMYIKCSGYIEYDATTYSELEDVNGALLQEVNNLTLEVKD